MFEYSSQYNECVVPENIHTSMNGNFEGGRGILKAKIFKELYDPKLEFPGGGGSNQKPYVGGVWIYSGTTQCK